MAFISLPSLKLPYQFWKFSVKLVSVFPFSFTLNFFHSFFHFQWRPWIFRKLANLRSAALRDCCRSTATGLLLPCNSTTCVFYLSRLLSGGPKAAYNYKNVKYQMSRIYQERFLLIFFNQLSFSFKPQLVAAFSISGSVFTFHNHVMMKDDNCNINNSNAVITTILTMKTAVLMMTTEVWTTSCAAR